MQRIRTIRVLILLAGAVLLPPAPARAQSTERVSVNTAGFEGNGDCRWAHFSADARHLVYMSVASNLVPGDTNGVEDVFLHDRLTGRTTRLSVNSLGAQGNAISADPAISHNGVVVGFVSAATNLVQGDTNGVLDVFVHDRGTGRTERVSVNSAGGQSNGQSPRVTLSGDGRWIAFDSLASNLVPGDTNGQYDVFVHDRLTGRTERASVNAAGEEVRGGPVGSTDASFSGDGKRIAFVSDASNLVPSDTNARADVFLADLGAGTMRRVSVSSTGREANHRSRNPTVSYDGRYVAFHSLADNLVPGDTNGKVDIFVHDLLTGQTDRVSVNGLDQQGNGDSFDASLSDDGRILAFTSDASNLVPGDTNGVSDLFVRERDTGRIERVSVGLAGIEGNAWSIGPSMDADGRALVFHARASNLVPNDRNGAVDIFVHERAVAGPTLARLGTCPGPVRISVSGAAPGGAVALLVGAPGFSVRALPPCAGLVLGISDPSLALVLPAGTGAANRDFRAPPAACGLAVQAVDLRTCLASNLLLL